MKVDHLRVGDRCRLWVETLSKSDGGMWRSGGVTWVGFFEDRPRKLVKVKIISVAPDHLGFFACVGDDFERYHNNPTEIVKFRFSREYFEKWMVKRNGFVKALRKWHSLQNK